MASTQLAKILQGKIWRFFGGIRPHELKTTTADPIEELPLPSLITLPLAALIVAWFLKTSYLDAGLFIRHAPVVPVLLFLTAIFAFVGLAYYLGARKLLRCSLTELLRDESAV